MSHHPQDHFDAGSIAFASNADCDRATVLFSQLANALQSEQLKNREAADAIDAQAERIKALEEALDMATQGKYSELMLRLADQCSAVRAMKLDATRIKALEGDAERYRWLRDEYWDFNVDTHGIWDSDSTQLDATIDRARALLGEK